MSDRVRLGGGGNIKTNARVVLRAPALARPAASSSSTRYWVGRTFDTFDGREWRGHRRRAPPRPRVMLGARPPAT